MPELEFEIEHLGPIRQTEQALRQGKDVIITGPNGDENAMFARTVAALFCEAKPNLDVLETIASLRLEGDVQQLRRHPQLAALVVNGVTAENANCARLFSNVTRALHPRIRTIMTSTEAAWEAPSIQLGMLDPKDIRLGNAWVTPMYKFS